MPYSPYLDAAEGFQNLGRGIPQLGLANFRFRQQQDEERQQHEQALMALRFQIAKMQNDSKLVNAVPQADYYKARTGLAQARVTDLKQKEEQQRNLADVARSVQQYEELRDLAKRGEAYGIPAPDGFYQQLEATRRGAIERSAMMQGHSASLLTPHNVGQNQIAIDPVNGGTMAQGPQVLNEGQQYTLDGSTLVNPRKTVNVPAGGTVFNQQTQKPMYTAPGKPGNNYGNVLPELVRAKLGGDLTEPGSPMLDWKTGNQMTNKLGQPMTTPMTPEWGMYTNLMNQAQQPQNYSRLLTTPDSLAASAPTNTAAQPISSSRSPNIFPDKKTGKLWKYNGTGDPRTDPDSSNWEEVDSAQP